MAGETYSPENTVVVDFFERNDAVIIRHLDENKKFGWKSKTTSWISVRYAKRYMTHQRRTENVPAMFTEHIKELFG